MRARLALDVSGQACELREILLSDKPEEMLRASPKGTVPVLIDENGAVIDESLDIMLWSLQRRDPQGWLHPHEQTLEDMLDSIRTFDTHFKWHLDRYKYPNRFTDADPYVSRTHASDHVYELQTWLSRHAYLRGQCASILDFALMPFVRQFANVDTVWFASQPWAEVQRWLTRMTSSDRFLRIMRPVKAWVPGTPGVDFPFVG